jgi:catechol 2,3-dioxygenase-like lactoylglutathione lyase family enzyme
LTASVFEEALAVPATATAAVRFHAALNVANLDRAVQFYRALLGTKPAKHHDDYAKFELDNPPLVLALVPSPQLPGGALNHLGLRLPDSAALVEVQRRLEEGGMPTQRQEGVECCYARQTKFWVTDPDGNLWEVYTLHEDLDHSGFDDPPAPGPPAPAAAGPRAVWQHRLPEPLPARIPHADGSVDEVWLEGTLNGDAAEASRQNLLAEVRRVLKPGGKVALHGLVGDRPFPGKPALPGLAGLVQRIPVETQPLDVLRQAGFAGIFYEKLGDIHGFQVEGVELREMRLVAWKAAEPPAARRRHVLYKGPFAQVTGEDGTVYPRGEKVAVSQDAWERLGRGPAAGQFLLFPA